MPDQKVMSQIDHHNVITTGPSGEIIPEIDNRTSYDRMRSPLKEGDETSVLPIIKSRLGMIDADATPHDAQVTKSYATNPVQNPNYKESKDIFEQKFTKEIDR